MLRRQTFKFQVSTSSACLCHGKSVIQVLFTPLSSVAGGLMVFPAILRVSLFEADDDTDDSKNDCTFRCVILLQLDLE